MASSASSLYCSNNKKKMLTLISDNGETFEIEESVISQSLTIKSFIEEDDCTDNEIPLPNVSSKILSMVIEYCKRHAHQDAADSDNNNNNKVDDEVIKSWDKEFMNVDEATLLDLTVAASYLNVNSLIDLTRQSVAHMLNGKTPREEHRIRSENWWAFE